MDFAGMKRRELQALCKRHGLPAGGTNADLVARLDAALSGGAGAEEEEVVRVAARKGCLKSAAGDADAGEAKKVTFAVQESSGRRLRSRVVWSPVVAKTRGKHAEAGSAADDCISAEAGPKVPVRRSRRSSLTAAEAEEIEATVTVDRKRKRKGEEIAEDVAVSAQAVASRRVTRRSSLSVNTVLLPPAVEKKRGRGKAADGKNKLAAEEQVPEAQDLSAAATVVESKRSRRKLENHEPDVHKSAKVEVSSRITRSRSAEAVVMSPTVVENKRRRKTGVGQPNVELPTVSEELRNDAPVTRSLRNRVVQVNDSVVEENRTSQQLENNKQPSRPATRRHKQVESSVEEADQEQVAAPSKALQSRRSGRNNSEASTANSENNKLGSALVEAKDLQIAYPLTRHNATAEDVEKQPTVKKPARRSTHKSVVSAMLDSGEDKDPTEEKNPEAHVRRSTRRSIVPVEDIKGAGKEIEHAKGGDAVKQSEVKEPVRRSTRKSLASAMHEKEEKELIAEKNPGPHVRRSSRKSVVPVKDVSEDIPNNKGDNVEKQLVVKQPVRRSSRKSVLPDTLENESGFMVAETNAEAHVRRSTQKSVLPNMINKENPDLSKMARNGNFQISKCEGEKQQIVNVPVRRSRRSVATVMIEEQNRGLHEEKISKVPIRRSTRKSVASNVVEKGSMDNTEKVEREQSGAGTRKLKVRDQHTDHGVAVVISGNDSQATHRASDSTTSKGRSSKRRRTTVPEEVMLAEEANDDMVTREATKDACKVSHEYSKESSSRIQEICQVNATREEFSSGPLLGTVTLPDDICATESVCKVIPGSESGEIVKESLDKSKQPQEQTDIQDDDSHLSETRNEELDQSSSIAELLSHNGFVLEDETSMGEASGSALPISGNNPEIHCDTIAEESIRAAYLGNCPSKDGKGNLLLTNLHSEGAADDSILPVLNAAKGCSSDERHSSFGLEFMFTEMCKESCSGNVKNTAVEVDGGNKSSTCLTPGFYVGSDSGLEDEEVQPTGFHADKKLDVDQDATEEEVAAEQKSYDEHAAIKTDLETKLNGELTGLDMESDCSMAEKDMWLVADNPDEEATVQVQQGDVQKGDPEKPSQFSATPECKHERGLPEETVLHSDKNKGCSSNVEQSTFGLKSLFSQESIEKSVKYDALASATIHMENGFDELKECHVKRALEKAHVSVAHHDIDENSCWASKNDDCVCTSQQDNGIEGSSKSSLDEEWVTSGFLLDAKHIKEGTNSEEVACKSEASNKPIHSDDLESSSQKADVNGQADNAYAYGVNDAELNSTLHAPANGNNDACLGSNIELLHQGRKDKWSEDTEGPMQSGSNERSPSQDGQLSFKLEGTEEISHSQDGQLNSKLEGTKVVDSGCDFSKDINSVLDNGSVVGTVGERTLSGSGLPKDLSIEYNLQQEHLYGSSVKKFLGSTTYGGKNVSRVDTSFSLSTPSYKHEGALSEEAVHTMKKYAGTCSSNPRELLMDLQSLFSKEKIEESVPHDGFALPSAESPGDESIDIEQRVEVHLGSNLSQLESTDVVDVGCSKTEVYKDQCSEDREDQFASVPCTYDIVEAPSAKHIESGAVMLPPEERSNLKDGLFNSKQENIIVMESGLSCDNDVANTSYSGSVVDIVGQKTPSGSDLPEDYCADHNLQQKFLDGCRMESSSLQGSTIFGKKNVSGVGGSIENAPCSLATPDYKDEGALPEEAARKLKNDNGTCSADPKHLLMELQSLFSEGSIENSDSHDDLVFPSAESGRNEPSVCHFEKPGDTLVSSEPDTYQCLLQDLCRAEEKESCMSTSVQHDESEGFLSSSHMKDRVTSAHINLSDDAHLFERNIVVEEVFCEEKEKRKALPTSDSGILLSCSNEYGIGQSHGPKHIVEINSKLLSCDTEMLHQDHKEDSNRPSDDKIIPKVLGNDMSEAAPIEGMESAIMLPSVAVTLGMPDEQLKTKLNDEGEEHSFSCDKDTFEIKGCPIDSCQKQEVSDVLSVPKSREEPANCLDESVSGSGPCQTSGQQCINESSSMQVTSNTEAFNHDHEENYGNNEGQITPGVPASNMSEDADIERSEMEIGLPPSAGISALPDEQLKPPSDLSAPRSPEESTVLQNYCVPGSVGICQSSRRRGIDELRAKLQSFKVSSTVKGSYIGMSALRPKQCDNLGQSAIVLLQNRENTPAVKADHPAKPDPDCLVAEENYGNNEGQITPVIPASNMSEDADIEKSEMEIGLPPDAGISALPDEHLKPPSDLSAPRYPEESTVLQNYCVPGSVGICQSSRRGIKELCAKLQSFKVSSTVKGSYIGRGDPRPKQCDNLGESAIALLRNKENTPAVKADHAAKPNPDRSVVKDSSRRALQPTSGRPRDH